MSTNDNAIWIGDRRELFLDYQLIDTLSDAWLQLNVQTLEPHSQDQAVHFSGYPTDHERAYAYSTVLHEPPLYRLYYRGFAERASNAKETLCYAESEDGVHFVKPDLGLHDVAGSRHNNVLLTDVTDGTAHNFTPMRDTRPGVPADQQYKALAGLDEGLKAFVSGDGIHWQLLRDEPVIGPPAHSEFNFDSQNVSFWSEAEQQYVAYFRTWKSGVEGVVLDFPELGTRWFSRTVSDDYIHWSEPEEVTPDNGCYEHIYTTQTHPYFRAPHHYIALCTRFVATGLDTFKNSVDIALMSSRPGTSVFNRSFMESFIRPGLEPARWGNRFNYTAYQVVPVSDTHMAIYLCGVNHRLRKLRLRKDGFASLHAGYRGGELLTKPFIFEGNSLELNAATSAVGQVAVELQTAAGTPIDGYTLADCMPLNGDRIAWTVPWQRGDTATTNELGQWAGKPVRLRFALQDADVYSFQFYPASES